MALPRADRPHWLQVNAGLEGMQAVCEALGVAQLPFFHMYSGGQLVRCSFCVCTAARWQHADNLLWQVSHFSANLSRVDRLRSEIAKLQELHSTASTAASAAGEAAAQLPDMLADLGQQSLQHMQAQLHNSSQGQQPQASA